MTIPAGSQNVVLCVDPDPSQLDETIATLEAIPSTTAIGADTVVTALDRLDEAVVDCVVTEYDLPDGTGFDLVAGVRNRAPDAGAVLYTDADRAAIDTDAADGVVAEFVPKDLGPERLLPVVRTAVELGSQRSYPLPDDEDARLAAINDVDFADERLQAAVERVTDLAADHFGVPTASINVVGDHTQEFLVCQGADWESIPREQSICTVTMLEEGVSVVEDAKSDPRFAHRSTLQDLPIRFYAGATLDTPAGHTIGTLCIYDDEPGTLDETGRARLDRFAAVVTDLIAFRCGTAGGAADGAGGSDDGRRVDRDGGHRS